MTRSAAAGVIYSVTFSLQVRDVGAQLCVGLTQPQCGGDCEWRADSEECAQICVRSGTAYVGGELGVSERGSRLQCKQHCENTLGCSHYTYYMDSRNCYLHDNSAALQTAEATARSGDPSCDETPPQTTTPTSFTQNTGAGSTNFAGSTGDSGVAGSTGNAGFAGSTGNTGAPAATAFASDAVVPAATAFSDSGQAPAASVTSAGSALNDVFASPQESMPSSVGSAMVVGRADSTEQFSGLSSVLSVKKPIVASSHGWTLTLGAGSGSILIVALALIGLQRRLGIGVIAPLAEE